MALSFGTTVGYGQSTNTNGDHECQQAPTESISSLAWAPQQLVQQGKNFLAASSWDKTVRVWEVQMGAGKPASNAFASFTNDQPVFDCSMAPDGRVFFGGGCQTAKMVNLAQPSAAPTQVASHDLPVKCVRYVPDRNFLLTGGWDGMVKVWDCNSPKPGMTLNIGAPVVAMDVTGLMCTVATARSIVCYNLETFREVHRTPPHHTVKEQLRCVANFPDNSGFMVASTEGRAAVMWLSEIGKTKTQTTKNYAFKCHRENTADVFSVNAIAFHPQLGTLATCGSNGGVVIWDKDSKSRIKVFPACRNTIPCGTFDSTGQFFAYALSYDWTKGAAQYNAQLGHKICIKKVTEEQFRPKKR